MARNLYRFYLYTIFIALVVFVVFATGMLLNIPVDLIPFLRGTDTVPTQAIIVQSLVFALVSWIIAGTLGALHYWLIRQDIRNNPDAGTSAIRAFFLNGTELFGSLVTTLLIGATFANWAFGNNGFGNIATALPVLAMVLLLEWERRRTPMPGGLALVFQRLHLFGGQLLLLAFFLVICFVTLPVWICVGSNCQTVNPWGMGSTMLWFLLCWLIYCGATSRDPSRIVRMLLHGISFAVGIGFALFGAFLAIEAVLAPLFRIKIGISDMFGASPQYGFATPLLSGLLVILVYHLLLRNLSKQGLTTQPARRWAEGAIAAVLLGVTFWLGCGYGIYNLLQLVSHIPGTPDSSDWQMVVALIVTGAGYIGLDFLLQRASRLDLANTTGPRRGFVLALLGGGILSFAGGGATALYAWGTHLLGSSIANWLDTAQTGLATAIIGAIVIGIYLWATWKEHLMKRQTAADQPTPPAAPVPNATIEEVLDALLATQIGREEAAKRLHALS
jgi:hypothetical protein